MRCRTLLRVCPLPSTERLMKTRLLVGFLFVLSISIAATAHLTRPFADDQEKHPLDGKPAPAFSLDLLKGGKATLADHKNKNVVILDFWATWCGPCVQAMPIVSEVAKSFADKGVVLYAVNEQEEADAVKAFLEK